MHPALHILETHPAASELELSALAACVEATLHCSQVCTSCADACLAEPSAGEMVACIRTDMDCADICAVTTRVLTRQTEPDYQVIGLLLEACIAACDSCAMECEEHAEMHQHCRICMETCRECLEACQRLLDQLPTEDMLESRAEEE